MPIHSIARSGKFHIIDTGSKIIDTSKIKISGPGGQIGRNDRMKAGLQLLFDTITPLVDLPLDDPDRTTDPNTPRDFWDGSGNLVSRSVIVTEVIFEAGNYSLTLEAAK